jgi:hypothetical protein
MENHQEILPNTLSPHPPRRFVWVIPTIFGAACIITGLFFPLYSLTINGRSLFYSTNYQLLQQRYFVVLLPSLLAVFTPIIIVWHLRSSRAQWWLISLGAIFFFSALTSVFSVGSFYVAFSTSYPNNTYIPVYHPIMGWYVTVIGNVLLGIGTWRTASKSIR